jgi:hypothetical protein
MKLEMRGQVIVSGKRLRGTVWYPTSELVPQEVDRVNVSLHRLRSWEHLPFSILVFTVGKFARVYISVRRFVLYLLYTVLLLSRTK